MQNTKLKLVTVLTSCCLLLGLGSSPAVAETKSLDKIPGYVDGAAFIELAGDDAVTVEISIHGGLLKMLGSVDPELEELMGGLESIHAVILEVEEKDAAAQIRDLMGQIERKLLGQGWQRLARVKEDESEVRVLVLNDEEAILGLVVLVADDENEFVFANIAGKLNLAALSKIGESFDIPGLDELGNGD